MSYIISVAKSTSKKIIALIGSMKFFLKVALYLYKYTVWSCMEYCYLVWAGAPNYLCNFIIRDIKIQILKVILKVYLELPQKINFNLVIDFLIK